MVSRLAVKLIERYASDADRLLDPFCGSGTVLRMAHQRGIPVTGVDLNPIAGLFTHVKLRGFVPDKGKILAQTVVRVARATASPLEVSWPQKHYWFTPETLCKFERLRSACRELDIAASDEGIAVLLGLALSVRLCSRADQRSPKPFISRLAIEARKGKHFDPYRTLTGLVGELAVHYGTPVSQVPSRFFLGDVARDMSLVRQVGNHSHVITSPPYINAQDYFRNFKLELHMLQGVLPFRVDDVQTRFIGTERGDLGSSASQEGLGANLGLLPTLRRLDKRSGRLKAVVCRYISDMGGAFDFIKDCIAPRGCLVLICGDNLVGGIHIRTWQVLRKMLENRGFTLFDRFSDPIRTRMLAPKRLGHKGIIKEEVVCAYRSP